MKLENFYNHLLVQEGLQDITVVGYRKVLDKFFRENKHFNRKAVENYVAEMRKTKYSYSHIANTCVALEKLGKYIRKPIKLGRPRKPKQIIKNTLTEGEIARILAAVKNKREEAILAILIYTGIRNRELCRIKVGDMDFDNHLLRILDGKGSKDRIVYFSKECAKILLNYLGEYKREDKQFLFATLVRGNQYNGWALRKLVKVVSGRANVKKRVFPHLFRHSFACNLLGRGANIMTIKELLGHESIQTTMLYTHSTPQRVQSEYAFYMPSFT